MIDLLQLVALDVLHPTHVNQSNIPQHLKKVSTYPALLRVILNGTVRAELAHLRRRADTLLDPSRAVLVGLIDKLQRLQVYPHVRVSILPFTAIEDRNHVQESKSSVNK